MTRIPRPGSAVRGSRTGAPIMALFDLLGRRWAMGVLWTVGSAGPLRFRELQERCDNLSPTVLNQRLKELQEAKFIERSEAGYVATPLGLRVYKQLIPLGLTAKEWGRQLQSESDE